MTFGWKRSAPAIMLVSTVRPRPVLSRASNAAAMPRQAKRAEPTVGRGCITCTGGGRNPGIPPNTPMRARTRSSIGGSSFNAPRLPYAVKEQLIKRGLIDPKFLLLTRVCRVELGAKSSTNTSAPATSFSKPSTSLSKFRAMHSLPRSQTMKPPSRNIGALCSTTRMTRAP